MSVIPVTAVVADNGDGIYPVLLRPSVLDQDQNSKIAA
jgi:hypothetical protein